MRWVHRHLFIRFCLAGALSILPAGCLPFLDQPEPLPSGSPVSPLTLTLEELPVEEALSFFQDDISQQMLATIDNLNASGILSIHTLAKFGPSSGELEQGPAVVIRPDESLSGYLLLSPALDMPHTFGLFASLDYEPIPVYHQQSIQTMPRVHLAEGIKAFRFALPPSPEGVHCLVVNYIAEPDISFDALTLPYSETVRSGVNWRDMPSEFGLLIWSTNETPQSAEEWPPMTHPIPPGHTEFITSMWLQEEKPGPGESLTLLARDSLRAGESVTYQLLITGSNRGRGEIPLRVLVVWDERLSQVLEYNVPVDAANRGEFIPLTFQVPEDLTAGDHTLTLLGFDYPDYLRGFLDDPEWDPNVAFFSHLITHLAIRIR